MSLLMEEDDDSHPCTCNLLSLIWKVDDKKSEQIMADNISFTMFQSYRFKILVGFAYILNLPQILEKSMIDDDNRFGHLSVQILTVPSLTLDILKKDDLREIFWNSFKKYSKIERNSPPHYRRCIFSIHYDFKYMLKKEPIQYLLQQGFMEEYLEFCKELCLRDAVANPTAHILYQNEGYFVNSIDYQYQINKVSVLLFGEVDYMDLEFNKGLAKVFQKKIQQLLEKYNENIGKGYVEDPLLK